MEKFPQKFIFERPNGISRYSTTNKEYSLNSTLPLIQQSARSQSLTNPQSSHHAKLSHPHSYKFSSHYISRFYQDNSFSKATKEKSLVTKYDWKRKTLEIKLVELKNKYQESKWKLLEKSQKKEMQKRLVSDIERAEIRYASAAITIQKHVRAFLTALKHPNEIKQVSKKKLHGQLRQLDRTVGKFSTEISKPKQDITPMVIFIQKHFRRCLAINKVDLLKKQIKAALILQRCVRCFLNYRRFKNSLSSLKMENKLQKIVENLKWIKFKQFWDSHKFAFRTIRRKYITNAESSQKSSSAKEISEINGAMQVSESQAITSIDSKAESSANLTSQKIFESVGSQGKVDQEPPPLENAPKDVDAKNQKEKKLPLYLRPTKAFQNRKIRPISPIFPAKDIKNAKSPSKQLTKLTFSRNNYTAQTQRYSKFTPIWKPPMTAHETSPRPLPKVHQEIPKVPDFIDGDIRKAKERQKTIIKANEESEYISFSEAEDSSLDYIPPPNNLTMQLGNALPELFSIVKNYGKNTENFKIRQKHALEIPSEETSRIISRELTPFE